MIARIQIRRDTASNWTANNPILTLGEIGYDTDTEKFKVGISNSSRWNDLPYELGQWRSDASGNISYGYASDGPAEGNVSINNDLFVGGDLTVKGTTTTINTEVATFKDDIIQLNLDVDDTGIYSGTLQSGFEVNRGNVPVIGQSTQKLYWDETSLKWVIDTDLNVLGDIYSNGVALWRLNGNDIYFDNGYVAIGLDNPSSVLHIKDVAPIITLEDENNPAHIWQVGQNADKFFINTETAADGSMFSMLEGGNVGIGTDNPATLLHLKDDTPANENTCLRLENDVQVWDLCNRGGDNDKFKLLDVNANTAPFIVEKAAAANSLYIKSDGSVGIGTSNPSAKLDVAGEINFSGSRGSFVSSLSQPRIYRSGSDQGTYPFDDFGHLILQTRTDGSNRDIVFATGTNGANLTVIDSDGNVAIGTSTQSTARLTVDSSTGNLVAKFQSSDANAYISFADNSTSTPPLVGAVADDFSVWTANTRRMTILNSNGNVGIGTESPGQILQVGGDVRGQIYIDGTSTQSPTLTLDHTSFTNGRKWILYSGGSAAENFDIYDGTANLPRFSIDENGNVGIGDTTPAEKLEVNGAIKLGTTSSTNAGTIRWTGFDFEGYDGASWNSLTSSGAVSSQWTTSGSDIYYNTGSVGIGTSSPDELLHVSDTSANSNPGIRIENDAQEWVIYNRGSASDRFQITDVTNTENPFKILPDSPTNSISITTGGVAMGKEVASEVLDVVGNITATGTITSSSDITLKENIELISDPIEKVKEISGYTFNKKGEDLRLVGLIAQEVEKVLPEAVAENNEGLKSVAYGNLVALLVECVKKQDERIESLERTIKEMK